MEKVVYKLYPSVVRNRDILAVLLLFFVIVITLIFGLYAKFESVELTSEI